MGNGADSGGTDLGRRIEWHRERAGLSVAETAERAGMSPDYLTYLVASPDPNPTHATLTRLAAALDVPLSALSGAGLNLPPGQRAAGKNPTLEKLTADECRAHIAAGGVGRFLFDDADRGPVAIPVNYRMDGDDVIFRTANDTSIAAAVHQLKVSFDVDHLDDVLGEGWSVLLSGTASIITEPAGLARARALSVEPWAGGDRDTYVRFTPHQISGRRIRVPG
jgi:transcriptional regulator with XRE-family HTH domain